MQTIGIQKSYTSLLGINFGHVNVSSCDMIKCKGNEKSIVECLMWTNKNFSSSDVAGVACEEPRKESPKFPLGLY